MNSFFCSPSLLAKQARKRLLAALLLPWFVGLAAAPAAAQVASSSGEPAVSSGAGGPVRLRQASLADDAARSDGSRRQDATRRDDDYPVPRLPAEPAKPTEFEVYINRLNAAVGGQAIKRFGAELVASLASPADAADYNPLIPPDYLLRPGDELVVTLWGSVDADVRARVDRSGRINIPRVGPVMVSGVRYADLTDTISKRVAQVFKNFQLSVSLGQLRGLRVYVTGFVERPGSVVVSSLSTLTQALIRAGGPSTAGSFRNIQLKRGRDTVATFDLYELLLKGDRGADMVLQPEDVILVGPVGPQVAIIGSVNRPAIFEIKPGEVVDDLLRMSGGLNAVADSRRLVLERMNGPTTSLTQIDLPVGAQAKLERGDVYRAFNAAELTRPTDKQAKRVRVEGEVAQPGEYVLPPTSTLADAVRAAGGFTQHAFLQGAQFNRESVRITQQVNYERALRDFETQLTTSATTRRASTAEEAAASTSATAANTKLFEQLRALRPTGRIVLQLPQAATNLPDLPLEDGDKLFVPARPTAVGVFGSVFSSGSYLFAANQKVGDYVRLAGGPTRGADDSSTFVIRANGSVESSLQASTFFSRGNQIAHLTIEPGDTIFVPEEINKATNLQTARDWTQVFFQLAVGLAGLKTATGM